MAELALSFDLDGLLAFNSCNGKSDRFLEKGIPEIVGFLEKHSLNATFFLVGCNVEKFPALHSVLKKFELGNHSFLHPKAFHSLSFNEKRNEIIECHNTIKKHFNIEPKIFRAPDYRIDSETIKILKSLGYWRDSSLLRVVFPPSYFFHYLKNKNIDFGFELPLSSTLLPFNGTTIVVQGLNTSIKRFESIALRESKILLNFHARDFTCFSVGNSLKERIFFRNRDRAKKTTLEFLEFAVNKCTEIGSIGEIFS